MRLSRLLGPDRLTGDNRETEESCKNFNQTSNSAMFVLNCSSEEQTQAGAVQYHTMAVPEQKARLLKE